MNILCFAPNDAVWLWTRPQAEVLKALMERGDTVSYVHCDRTLTQFCMSMASSGVSATDSAAAKEVVCARCVAQSKLVRNHLGCLSHALHAFVTDADLAEAERLIQMPDFESLRGFVLSGVPIGTFCHYEAVIQTQTIGPELNDATRQLYRMLFRNAVVVVRATERMIAQLKPDVGITYHSAYTYNRCFRHVFEQHEIPVWSLNASLNMSELDTHLLIARSEMLYKKAANDWDLTYCEVPASAEEHAATANHILSLMAGKGFAYSKALSKRAKAAIPPRSDKIKNVTAILSSYDELWASQLAGFELKAAGDVFKTQGDWVRWLFDFARRRSDIHLTVRVHPREFARGAGGHESEHARSLRAVFREKPQNATINLPEDGVSMYEVLFESDVVLVAWSSAGFEAGLFGIPVVTYFPEVLQFPERLSYLASSPEDYERQIEKALEGGWSLERSRRFFRWGALILTRTRVDLRDRRGIARSPFGVFCLRAFRYLMRRFDPLIAERLSLIQVSSRNQLAGAVHALIDGKKDMLYELADRDAEPVTLADEHRSMVAQLHRMGAYFSQATGTSPRRLDALISGRST